MDSEPLDMGEFLEIYADNEASDEALTGELASLRTPGSVALSIGMQRTASTLERSVPEEMEEEDDDADEMEEQMEDESSSF